MKNKIKIFFCLVLNIFFVSKLNAQTEIIVPLNTNIIDVENGNYLKDLDNIFIGYVGIWEGTWESKTFKFKIEKITHHLKSFPNGDYHYEDILVAKYQIIDNSNNMILFNTFDTLVYEDINIENVNIGQNNELDFLFIDGNVHCNIMGLICLKRNLSNPNTISYSYNNYDNWSPDSLCPYNNRNDVPIPIPKDNLILTKL